MDVLIENEYILRDIYDDYNKTFDLYDDEELGVLCDFIDLKDTGRRNTLIKRLLKQFKEDIDDFDFCIALSGLELLIFNNSLAHTVDLYEHYIYSELIDLKIEENITDSIPALEKFYSLHREHAKSSNDLAYYAYTLDKLSELYNSLNEFEKACQLELETFIILLNPQACKFVIEEKYDVMDLNNIKRLRFITFIHHVDSSDKFKSTWNNIVKDEKKLNVDYDDSYRLFKRILDVSVIEFDFDDILDEVTNAYY